MPGWPGFEGIQHIRSLLPQTPLVVVSASENGADARMALDHGAGGFIPKSSSVQIMVSALRLFWPAASMSRTPCFSRAPAA